METPSAIAKPETVKDRFKRLEHAPPKYSETLMYDPIKERIAQFLAIINKTDSDLDDQQRAKLPFWFLKNQDRLLYQEHCRKSKTFTAHDLAVMIWDLVDTSNPSESNRRLGVFMRRGGDNTSDAVDTHHGAALFDNFNTAYTKIMDGIEKHASATVPNFTTYPDFWKKGGNCEFAGDWNQQVKYADEEIANPNFCCTHSFIIVGAELTGDPSVMGGLKVLVQDSDEPKPFKIIGYDLLSSQGINILLVIGEGVPFNIFENSVTGAEHRPMQSGGALPGPFQGTRLWPDSTPGGMEKEMPEYWDRIDMSKPFPTYTA